MRKSLLLATLALGCGEPAPPDFATTRTEVEALVRKFHDSMENGDVEVVSQMLAPDASIAYGGKGPFYGHDRVVEVLKGFVDYHANQKLGKRKAMFDDIRIRQEGNIAIATYTVAFLAQPEGKPASTTVEAFTQVFKRVSGKWMLYHDHRGMRE